MEEAKEKAKSEMNDRMTQALANTKQPQGDTEEPEEDVKMVGETDE
jgi:hypothetical protein